VCGVAMCGGLLSEAQGRMLTLSSASSSATGLVAAAGCCRCLRWTAAAAGSVLRPLRSALISYPGLTTNTECHQQTNHRPTRTLNRNFWVGDHFSSSVGITGCHAVSSTSLWGDGGGAGGELRGGQDDGGVGGDRGGCMECCMVCCCWSLLSTPSPAPTTGQHTCSSARGAGCA